MGPATLTVVPREHGARLELELDGERRVRPFSPARLAALTELTRAYDRPYARATPTELERLGRDLGDWLESESSWLSELLERARATGDPLVLELRGPLRRAPEAQLSAPDRLAREGCDALLAAPWELLWVNGRFLTADPNLAYAPVRRLTRARATTQAQGPRAGALTVLFMAAAPVGETSLDFEAEEAVILAATRGQELDLFVEETGTARELGLRALRLQAEGPVHVVHLTCLSSDGPEPRLVLESDVGAPAEITASELCAQLDPSTEELGLLVLSTSSSAAVQPRGSDPGSLAWGLVRHDLPAVLGWAGGIEDAAATAFAGALYAALARGDTSLELAVASARQTLCLADSPSSRSWHLARLFLGPRGGGLLCEGPGAGRRRAPVFDKVFLDDGRQIPVAGPDQFVGRRRALQDCVRALRDVHGAGVLIQGFGNLGKSSLAARAIERMSGSHLPVVFHGEISGRQLISRLSQTLGPGVKGWETRWLPLAGDHLEDALREVLDGRLNTKRALSPIVLVLDDFEQMLERRADDIHRVQPPHLAMVRAILRAFAHSQGRSRLVITSRYAFELRDHMDRDLTQELSAVPLESMSTRETSKRTRRVADEAGVSLELCERCGLSSRGNPGLLDLLLARALEDPQACARLVERLEQAHLELVGAEDATLHDFLVRVTIEDLIERGLRPRERELLGLSVGFEVPLPLALVPTMSELCAASPADGERLLALGVWEESRDIAEPSARAFAANRLVGAWMQGRAELPCPERWRAVLGAVLPKLCVCWSELAEREPKPAATQAGYEMLRLGLSADFAEPARRFGRLGLEWAVESLEIGDARRLSKDVVELLDRHASPQDPRLLRLVATIHQHGPDGEFHGTCLTRAMELAGDEWAWTLKPKERAEVLRDFASMIDRRGQTDRALRLLRDEVLPVFEALRDDYQRALTLGRIAELLAARGELEEALQIHEEQELVIYERIGDEHARAVTLGEIADIHYRRGNYDEALRIREEEELPVYEDMDDDRSCARARGRIADILFRRGELARALDIRERDQLPAYAQAGDVHAQAVTWGKIADVHAARGELDEALHIHETRELPVFERLGDVRSQAITWGKIADIYQRRSKLDDALEIRAKQLRIFEGLHDVHGEAVVQGKIADIRETRGELEEVLRIRRDEQLPVYERLDDILSVAITWGKIADVLLTRGECAEALRIYEEHELPVYERLGDVRSSAIARGKIADAHVRLGQLDEAMRICRSTHATFESLLDRREAAFTLGQIADIHLRRGELDEAMELSRRQLPVYEALEDIREQATTWGRIATVHKARSEFDEAMEIYYERQLSVYEPIGDIREVALTWGEIAEIVETRGDLDEGMRIRQELELPIYERLGDEHARAVTWGYIASVHAARGELDEALAILHEDVLPVLRRLGDVNEFAAASSQAVQLLIALEDYDAAHTILHEDVLPVCERLHNVSELAVARGHESALLAARGELDEALRVRLEEELPIYEELGDAHGAALAWGQVAALQHARGQLAETVKIYRERELPVYERLGDIRSQALTLGQLAEVLAARGELDEALRVCRTQQLPLVESVGDARMLIAARAQAAMIHSQRARPEDRAEIISLLAQALKQARQLELPEAPDVAALVRHVGGDPDLPPFCDPPGVAPS